MKTNFENTAEKESGDFNTDEPTPASEVDSWVYITPAILIALSACSEQIPEAELAQKLQEGIAAESVSAEDLSTIRNAMPRIQEAARNKRAIEIRTSDGTDHMIYFPTENTLVIARKNQDQRGSPSDRYLNRKRDTSYAFEENGVTVRSTGLGLDSAHSGVPESRTIIQEIPGHAPTVTYSIMYDFGSQRSRGAGRA